MQEKTSSPTALRVIRLALAFATLMGIFRSSNGYSNPEAEAIREEAWTLRNPQPTVFPQDSIVRGNGIFLAVGESSLVLSKDGKSWRKTGPAVSSLAYGNGVFVAVGGGQIARSIDGLSWQTVVQPSRGAAVVFGAGKFVVGGPDGYLQTSSNGATWSQGDPGAEGSITSLAFGNHRFLAAVESYPIAKLIASSDGIAWTQVKRWRMSTHPMILFGNGRFAFDTSGAILASRDGDHWTKVAEDSWHANHLFRFVGGDFVLITNPDEGPNTILRSDDLRAWNDWSGELPTIRKITFLEGHYYVHDDHGAIHSSPNLREWRAINAITTQRLHAVACGSDRLVAVGARGTIVTSDDGVVWAARESATAKDLYAVMVRGGRFVAAGDDGTLLTSLDGASWHKIASGTNQRIYTLAFDDRLIVATTGAGVLTSADGSNWSHQNIHAMPERVAAGNGVFVVAGESGPPDRVSVFSSSDGIRWTSGVPPPAERYRAFYFDQGLFHVETESDLLTSTDGVWWKDAPLPKTRERNGVPFGSGDVALEGSQVVWKPSTFLGGRIPPCYFKGQFVTVGNNGAIATLRRDRPEPRVSVSPTVTSGSPPSAFTAKVFAGEIDRQDVVTLTLDREDRVLRGHCSCVGEKALRLEGSVDGKDVFDLTGLDETGKTVARLQGQFLGEDMVGQWATPGRPQPFHFYAHESSEATIAARQEAFRKAFKNRVGTYRPISYSADGSLGRVTYDCARRKGGPWRCGGTTLTQGRREPLRMDVPYILAAHRIMVEVDDDLTIHLLLNGTAIVSIPVSRNRQFYFPGRAPLAKDLDIPVLAGEEPERRFTFRATPDLASFSVGDNPSVTFEKIMDTRRKRKIVPGTLERSTEFRHVFRSRRQR